MKTETEATITPEERKELNDLFVRHDVLSELVTTISLKGLTATQVSDWILKDCEKSIKRMKELNAKY